MSEKGYIPPYTISDKTVNWISAITEIITKITINDNMSNNPKLRKDNRIRTIHASLAIENNSLSLDQDDENETFITGYSNVNSRSLIDVLTLKRSDDKWYRMDVR